MNIQYNIELKPYNSFRTKAIAKLFAQPATVNELQTIISTYKTEQKLVVGGGCNLFFTKDFDGLIIHPQLFEINVIDENEQTVTLEVGASEDWDEFVEYCVSNNYAGLENLSFIPGTVGASPVQNIGAYGAEVKDTIVSVHTVDIETSQTKTFLNEECDFSYRNSLFKQTQRYVITSVVFRLKKAFTYTEKYADLNRELANVTQPTLQQVREAVIKVRQQKLPNHLELPNAGSFFKNPILTSDEKDKLITLLPEAPLYAVGNDSFKTSAAYLIDSAGCKGMRVDNVGVYDKHALIIVNYGTESGAEIKQFMNEIRDTVFYEFGVILEPEVWIF